MKVPHRVRLNAVFPRFEGNSLVTGKVYRTSTRKRWAILPFCTIRETATESGLSKCAPLSFSERCTAGEARGEQQDHDNIPKARAFGCVVPTSSPPPPPAFRFMRLGFRTPKSRTSEIIFHLLFGPRQTLGAHLSHHLLRPRALPRV